MPSKSRISHANALKSKSNYERDSKNGHLDNYIKESYTKKDAPRLIPVIKNHPKMQNFHINHHPRSSVAENWYEHTEDVDRAFRFKDYPKTEKEKKRYARENAAKLKKKKAANKKAMKKKK